MRSRAGNFGTNFVLKTLGYGQREDHNRYTDDDAKHRNEYDGSGKTVIPIPVGQDATRYEVLESHVECLAD